MKGDRVVVGDGYHWEPGQNNENKTMAYMPVLDGQGNHVTTPDGGTVVEGVGGVVCGSTGTIQGPIVNTHRSYVHSANQTAAMGGKDFIQLIPVFLDKYQRLGYFPVDNTRIFGGARV